MSRFPRPLARRFGAGLGAALPFAAACLAWPAARGEEPGALASRGDEPAVVAAAASAADEDAAPGALLLPPEPGLRDDLAWLVDRRVLDVPLGTWPMPAALVHAQLRVAARRAWPAADADALRRVEGALARARAPARAGLRVDTARHPALDGEASARGAARAHAALQSHHASWSVRLQVDALADPLSEPRQHASLAGSYAALALPGAVLALGAVDRWWGPGRASSPLLSDAAEPFPALLLRRAVDDAPSPRWLRWIGPWGYELSAGQLLDYTPRRTRTIGMRVHARPAAGLEIGLSRHILWAGAGRPRGWSALRDALLARSNIEPDGEDPSDELAGLDLRYSLRTPAGWAWVAHGMLIGEDEAGKLPSRRLATVGAQLKLPHGDGRLEWSVEATDTRLGRLFGLGDDLDRAAYRHAANVDGYYHQGLPLGAAIGGGGHLLALGLDWQPGCDAAACVRYGASLFAGSVSEPAPQDINAAFGARGRLRGLSLRRVSTSRTAGPDWSIGLTLQHYRAGDRPDLGLQAGFELPLGDR